MNTYRKKKSSHIIREAHRAGLELTLLVEEAPMQLVISPFNLLTVKRPCKTERFNSLLLINVNMILQCFYKSSVVTMATDVFTRHSPRSNPSTVLQFFSIFIAYNLLNRYIFLNMHGLILLRLICKQILFNFMNSH